MDYKKISEQAKILLHKFPEFSEDGRFREVGFFLKSISEDQTEETLKILRRETKGSAYLCDAIILASDCGNTYSLVQDIYPKLAEKYGRSSSAIEFSIRNEINYLISVYPGKKFEKAFGLDPEKNKITAKAFISSIIRRATEC